MKVNQKDIEYLAELKRNLSPDAEITISREMAKEICRYCEDQAVYDKLANYGDFYYKLKRELEKQDMLNSFKKR